ncbi:MAG TPA: CoA transferase [Acidimicrobiales bacterium]|nr:CoA transferase [Acidimicrobiales bacterium]
MPSTRSGPLDGIQVIELANYVSGPFATMMLGDLGADVIKVEPPKGDPLRSLGRDQAGVSPVFVSSNRGKRSVCLNLKLHDAQMELKRLLATADVLVSNWRPAVAARLGLVDDELAKANPRLIRVYVSGFGPDGPLADAPSFDSIIQARLGWTHGYTPDSEPSLATSYVVDKMSAAMVCQATLAALVARERLGVAERVDISMLDANAYTNFPDIMANRTFVARQPDEARNLHAAALRPIEASDGWVVVAPVSSHQIRRACLAVGREQLGDELLAMDDAVQLTKRFFNEIEFATRRHTVAHWLATFATFDVPAAPCSSLDEHLDDEQVRHNELYSLTEWAGLGPVRHVRYPAKFSTWGYLRARSGPPTIGEHSQEILTGSTDA